MRFADLLRAGASLSTVTSGLLGLVAVVFGAADLEQWVVGICATWWLLAAGGAIWLMVRRGGRPTEGTQNLLAQAPAQRVPEEPRVARVLLERLWPLLALTVASLALAVVLGPQAPGLAAGLAVALAITWRAEELAVRAIEERDGVVFLVTPTGPFKAVRLVRGPGLRRDLPTRPTVTPTPTP